MLRAIVECTKNKITQREYYEFRTVLIGEIIFRNAQRSGVILGMKNSEVNNVQLQGDKLKIIVYHHKTGKLKPAVIF